MSQMTVDNSLVKKAHELLFVRPAIPVLMLRIYITSRYSFALFSYGFSEVFLSNFLKTLS